MRSSKRYFALLFLLFALAFAGVNQTNYVQAKETTQKICLYLGQKITLADLPEGEVVLSKEHVVEVSANKVVTTIGAGTVTISVKTKAETVDYAEIEVKKNEIRVLTDSLLQHILWAVALFSCRYRSLNR